MSSMIAAGAGRGSLNRNHLAEPVTLLRASVTHPADVEGTAASGLPKSLRETLSAFSNARH